ncbi:MAG: RecX family transcriptional regulator [Bacteroidetes bacterium]|nr:RecX family transcriptional regulator [Bacteroidota bacterium]
MEDLTPGQKELLSKLMKYCAYQERCFSEAEQKLASLGAYGEEAGEIILHLSKAGFLDEERYARAFARGKFRFKRWGRNKIIRELKLKNISDYCLNKGMDEIDDTEYSSALHELGVKYWNKLKGEKNSWIKRKKTGSYLIQKGYEPELVNRLLAELAEV